jgi:integrase
VACKPFTIVSLAEFEAIVAALADEQWPLLADLRHAHASWLLAGGADLQTVRERLGHRATERYLHTLPDADGAALAAFNRTRTGARYAVVS